ncbi:arsenate-mycothiol transferase ArsC [Natronorubrum halophilum]|uniref:arsenate-mycothiol transferase ArsC n=1 Tax=Natronorubrum halophilum TaxID=1702106 RepID=UPI0010C20096|nr:low molecular weight phosphatase family protein [Natronorubrum halophilum]
MTRIAFICVGNAGRSQMATAFAEQEREQRGLDDQIEIVTGGIDPHTHVHDDVIAVLQEKGIDISDRTPRRITTEDVDDAEYVVTMGCSIVDFVPDDWDGTAERWELDHPGGDDLNEVRAQRDELESRVAAFFDRIEPSNE